MTNKPTSSFAFPTEDIAQFYLMALISRTEGNVLLTELSFGPEVYCFTRVSRREIDVLSCGASPRLAESRPDFPSSCRKTLPALQHIFFSHLIVVRE